MVAADVLGAAIAGATGTAVALIGLLKSGRARWLISNTRKEAATQRPGLKIVQQPQPTWQPGDKLPYKFPSNEMLELDPSQLGARGMYPFVISAIVPRPIAFICSVSKTGIVNLSPYSYFGIMSHDPPVVCIGTCASAPTEKRPSPMKDSQQNIMDTGEWTLNMISEWFVEAANHTCGNYDPEVDELQLAGFTPVPSQRVTSDSKLTNSLFVPPLLEKAAMESEKDTVKYTVEKGVRFPLGSGTNATMVKPPRIQESLVQLECKLRDTHDVVNRDGKVTATVIIGEVVLAHANKHVCTTTKNGHTIVDLSKYAPVSRCGGDTYARITEAYDIPRPGKEWQERSNSVR